MEEDWQPYFRRISSTLSRKVDVKQPATIAMALQRVSRHTTIWGLFLFLLLFLTGCSVVNDRRRVTGKVTVDGMPLELGAISFAPVDEFDATGSGATVRDGVFELPAARGLRPGQYTVEVLAYRETGRTFTDPQMGQSPELEKLQFEQTDLEVTVQQDGPNHFEFALTLVQSPATGL